MINLQPVTDRLGVIILALHELAAAHIAHALRFRGNVHNVVAGAAVLAHTPAAHPSNDLLVRDLDGHHCIVDDADDDLIRHQLACVHILLGLQTCGRAVFHGGTQNVACGDRGDLQLLLQNLCLSTLTGTRSAQKDQFHVAPQLFQEALILTHQHLGLQRLYGLQRNAHHDDDGRTADGQGGVPHDLADQQGQDRHDAQIDSAEQGDLVQDLLNEVGGRLAGTEAGNEAAILLQVVGDLHGVELNGGIPTDGPLFVDKHGAQPETTEPSAEPTQSSSETAVTTSAPKTSGAELVTYESSITSETSASASVSESSSSVSYNVLSNNTTTVSRNAGVGLTTTQRTGAPLTGSKGINIAFVGLAVTGLAAIASKIKRKKNK